MKKKTQTNSKTYTFKKKIAHIIWIAHEFEHASAETRIHREKNTERKTVSHFWYCLANVVAVAVAGLTVVSCRFFPHSLLLRKPKNESKRANNQP